MIDLCVVNAWLLWRTKTENECYMPLFDFKQVLSEHLCKAGKSLSRKRGRPTLGARESSGTSSQRSPGIASHGGPSTQPKRTRKTPARQQDLPLNSVRTDNIGHLPEWQKNRQICQMCSQKTHVKCRKCKVLLCFNEKRNCFIHFHEIS